MIPGSRIQAVGWADPVSGAVMGDLLWGVGLWLPTLLASESCGSPDRFPGPHPDLWGHNVRGWDQASEFLASTLEKMPGSGRCGNGEDPTGPTLKPAFLLPHFPGFPQDASRAGLLCLYTALFLVWEIRGATSCASVSTVLQWVSPCPFGEQPFCVVGSRIARSLQGSGELGFGSGRWSGKKAPRPELRSLSLKPHLHSEQAQYRTFARL